jgi:hypothetical protein
MADKILTDISFVKKVVETYKQNPKPTLAGFCSDLGIKGYVTFLKYLRGDDEIAELLAEGYKYYVKTHEERLHGGNCAGSIFALKCIKALDFIFHDRDLSQDGSEPVNNKLTIEVIPNRESKPI